MPNQGQDKLNLINEKLTAWQQIADKEIPSNGWLKAIREALGLTTRQLAKRSKLSQSRIVHIEKSEVEGNLTLDTLREVAAAMDCKLVYAIVPKVSLAYILKKQLTKIAKLEVMTKHQTMSEVVMLVTAKELDEKIMLAAQKIWERKKRTAIWNEN